MPTDKRFHTTKVSYLFMSYSPHPILLLSIVFNSYFPCDPPYVTDQLREAGSFNFAMERLKTEMEKLQAELKKSVPFFSSRYKVNTSRINYFQASIYLFISIFFSFSS